MKTMSSEVYLGPQTPLANRSKKSLVNKQLTSSPISRPAPAATPQVPEMGNSGSSKVASSSGGKWAPPASPIAAGRWVSPRLQRAKEREAPPPASPPSLTSRRGSSGSSGSSGSTASQQSSNWRQNAAPPPPAPPARSISAPSWNDIKEGQVYHLPDGSQIPSNSAYWQEMKAENRTDNPTNHPCVVIGKELRVGGSKIVVVLPLTSFSATGSNGIPTHKSGIAWDRMTLCANHNAAVQPHNGLLDVEAGSEKFQKATYVNYWGQIPLPIEAEHLRQWSTANNKPIQFTATAVATIKSQHKRFRQQFLDEELRRKRYAHWGRQDNGPLRRSF